MTAMIEIRDLVKRFGSLTAVDGVSFTVDRGEVLGFLGPNGAGKTTTMRMITGFLVPDGGSVRVCGHDLLAEPMLAKETIGYLPEGAPLYADMTALGFLRFVAGVRGIRGAEATDRIRNAVQRLALEEVLAQPIETLSKGFKRRVGLAQAILHDPPVLILDEPTDGLDPNQKHEVRTLIRGMARDKAIIISTHILEEVDAVCSRAVIIAHGRVIADGTPAELMARSRYRNAVTVTLRGAVEGAREALAKLSGVDKVETTLHQDGVVQLVLLAKNGRPIIGEVSRHVAANGWRVEAITAEQGRLDEVFRNVTTGAAA